MTILKSKKDIETLDFIVKIINAFSNCDSWGECDLEEKYKKCDDALTFMFRNFKIKK